MFTIFVCGADILLSVYCIPTEILLQIFKLTKLQPAPTSGDNWSRGYLKTLVKAHRSYILVKLYFSVQLVQSYVVVEFRRSVVGMVDTCDNSELLRSSVITVAGRVQLP